MKKIIVLAFALGVAAPIFADTGTGDQLLLSIFQHVVGVTEFTTNGTTKLEFLDGIVQFGHYKKDYIVALDGGFCNNTTPDTAGHLSTTWGAHIHVISFINNYFNLNPDIANAIQLLELTPRWSYDTDVHHGILGITFGARIPFGSN